MHRKTLKREVRLAGRGLHSGEPCSVRLCPACPVDESAGIVFYREDAAPALRSVSNW